MKYKTLLAAAAALLFEITVYAHHSYDATYQLDKEVRIEGKIIQVLYRNPHSFMHIEAPDDAGAIIRWAVECESAGKLGKQGIARDTLRVGDEVSLMVNPARRTEDHRGRLRSLSRKSDGLEWTERLKKNRTKRSGQI